MKKNLLFFISFPLIVSAQSKFAQLDQELPTPNEYRNAAGAPGHNYYQQKKGNREHLREIGFVYWSIFSDDQYCMRATI